MDEMIELFSVAMQLEKGALGLFFELNYLVGLFTMGACMFYHFNLVEEFEFKPLVAKDPNPWNEAGCAAMKERMNSLQNFIVF